MIGDEAIAMMVRSIDPRDPYHPKFALVRRHIAAIQAAQAVVAPKLYIVGTLRDHKFDYSAGPIEWTRERAIAVMHRDGKIELIKEPRK